MNEEMRLNAVRLRNLWKLAQERVEEEELKEDQAFWDWVAADELYWSTFNAK